MFVLFFVLFFSSLVSFFFLSHSIWFGVTIRGDTENPIRVGRNSNIQDGCVLHADADSPLTICSSVTVGHQAMLHGCTIGENALIGMGATILNEAIIGKNCIIGAHSLVPEGKNIPDGSLVVSFEIFNILIFFVFEKSFSNKKRRNSLLNLFFFKDWFSWKNCKVPDRVGD